LLLWARLAGDIDRLLHGWRGGQQLGAAARRSAADANSHVDTDVES